MPRKYHRPPTVKRRKERKTNVPYAMPEDPGAANGGVAVEEEDVDAAEAAEAPVMEPAPVAAERRSTRLSTPSHIGRDYSYVRTELVRIAVVAAFLVVALIITAILRG